MTSLAGFLDLHTPLSGAKPQNLPPPSSLAFHPQIASAHRQSCMCPGIMGLISLEAKEQGSMGGSCPMSCPHARNEQTHKQRTASRSELEGSGRIFKRPTNAAGEEGELGRIRWRKEEGVGWGGV